MTTGTCTIGKRHTNPDAGANARDCFNHAASTRPPHGGTQPTGLAAVDNKNFSSPPKRRRAFPAIHGPAVRQLTRSVRGTFISIAGRRAPAIRPAVQPSSNPFMSRAGRRQTGPSCGIQTRSLRGTFFSAEGGRASDHGLARPQLSMSSFLLKSGGRRLRFHTPAVGKETPPCGGKTILHVCSSRKAAGFCYPARRRIYADEKNWITMKDMKK